MITNDSQNLNQMERPDNKLILLSASDIMEILGCGYRTLYNLMNQKDFPSFRINNKYYVVREDFLKWSREQVKKYHKL